MILPATLDEQADDYAAARPLRLPFDLLEATQADAANEPPRFPQPYDALLGLAAALIVFSAVRGLIFWL
jgi:hypothetical protein